MAEDSDLSPLVVGNDGTIYLAAVRGVLALSSSGAVLPGWPLTLARPYAMGLLPIPGGDLLALACDLALEPSQDPCVLHRLGHDGGEHSGWPVLLPGECHQPPISNGSTAYVVCSAHDQPFVSAFDSEGLPLPGWPVGLGQSSPSSAGSGARAELAPDGTLYVHARNAASASLIAFAPDSSVRPGWPIRLTPDSGFRMRADGRPLVWEYLGIPPDAAVADAPNCVLATHTRLSVLNSDGTFFAAWPRTIDGSASPPALAADGWVHASVSLERGGPRLVAFAPDGSDPPGWPVGFDGGSGCFSTGPWVAPDGSVVAVTDGSVVRLGRAGKMLAGWPYAADALLHGPCAELGPPPVPDPAFGLGGELYIGAFVIEAGGDRQWKAPHGVEVRSIGADGRLQAGWPFVVVPSAATAVPAISCEEGSAGVSLTPHLDGSVLVLAGVFSYDGSVSRDALWLLTPDGEPVS